MSTDTRPNSPIPVIRNHSIYYLPGGDLFIQVDSTLFRVHRYFFVRESDFWRNFLGSTTQGRTANDPITLPCNPIPSVEEFACLLWVFYNPRYSIYKTSEENWITIHELALCWRFEEVQRLCWRELERINDEQMEEYIRWYNLPRTFDPEDETIWTIENNINGQL